MSCRSMTSISWCAASPGTMTAPRLVNVFFPPEKTLAIAVDEV